MNQKLLKPQTMKNKFTLVTACMAVLLMPGLGFSQEMSPMLVEFEEGIVELKADYEELKKDVLEGKVKKEEARAKWEKQLLQFRAEKEKIFEKRVTEIESEYKVLVDPNDEEGVGIMEKINEAAEEMKTKMAEYKAFRGEVMIRIQSGALAKSEGLKMLAIERVRQREVLRTQRNERKAKISAEKFVERGIEVPENWEKMSEKERTEFRKESEFEKKKVKELSVKEVRAKEEEKKKEKEEKKAAKEREDTPS